MSKNLSIIIPCYNEESNIPSLLDEINESFDANTFEVILIDDASENILSDFIDLSNYEFQIIIERNSYNMGQTRSIKSGLKLTNFSNISIIDGDCQNPPQELKRLWDTYLNKNLDAIVSFRIKRNDNLRKKLSSFLGNKFSKFLTGSQLKDMGSSLKVVRKIILEDIFFNGDLHRFIGPILEKRKYKLLEVGVEHRERKEGKSNYGIGRVTPVLIDSFLFYFSDGFTRPLRYTFGKISIFFIFLSSLLLIIALFQKFLGGFSLYSNPIFTISLFGYLVSAQIFTLGINKDFD